MEKWIKVPGVPIIDGVLKNLSGIKVGDSIAALKTYIAMLSETDNKLDSGIYGTAQTTIEKLEDITGLSRALVVRGIDTLVAIELLMAKRQRGRTNTYTLRSYGDNPWGKIPWSNFAQFHQLHNFKPRGKINLNALKIYLFLSVSVDRATGMACRTYVKIEEKTGVRRNDIQRALAVLIEYQLISMHIIPSDQKANLPHSYKIVGTGTKKANSEDHSPA